MTLRDVRSEEFGARIARDLGKLGLTVGDGPPALEEAGLSARQKHRAEFLIEQRERLQALCSPKAQVDAYDASSLGRVPWSETFVRLGDITSLANCSLEGERLRKHIWDSLQGRDVREFKRFQEIFCRPEDFVVPRFIITPGRGNFVQFDGEARRACSSVLGTIVSPDRISLPFCEHLKLYIPEMDKGDPWARLQARADIKILQTVKLIWDASQRFRSSGRVRIICQPSSGLASLYGKQVTELNPEVLGKILISHEVPSGQDSLWLKRGIQFFADPHGSLRRAQHIDAGYDREIERTRRMEAELRILSARVDKDWRAASAEERDHLVAEARQIIAEAVESLGSPKNTRKVKAHSLLSAAREFRDSRNRINPSTVLVRVANALKALCDRLTEAESKAAHIHHDGKEAFDELERAQASIRLLGERIVNSVAPALPGLALFHGRMSPEQRAKQAGYALTRFGVNPDALQLADRAPYNLLAARLRANYQRLVSGLQTGDAHEAQEGLVCMHIVVKFHEVYATLEKIKADIPALERRLQRQGAARGVLEELLGRASVLKIVFSERQVIPQHRIDEAYARPFMQMRARLQEVERGLRHYQRQEYSEDTVREMLVRFKLYLDKTQPLAYLESK